MKERESRKEGNGEKRRVEGEREEGDRGSDG